MGGLRILRTIFRTVQGAPFVYDLAAVAAARFPLVGCQAQEAAGCVLVALFQGLGGLHILVTGLPFAFQATGALLGCKSPTGTQWPRL